MRNPGNILSSTTELVPKFSEGNLGILCLLGTMADSAGVLGLPKVGTCFK